MLRGFSPVLLLFNFFRRDLQFVTIDHRGELPRRRTRYVLFVFFPFSTPTLRGVLKHPARGTQPNNPGARYNDSPFYDPRSNPATIIHRVGRFPPKANNSGTFELDAGVAGLSSPSPLHTHTHTHPRSLCPDTRFFVGFSFLFFVFFFFCVSFRFFEYDVGV